MTEWEFLNEVVERGGLRHPARRQQHLRLLAKPQLRSVDLREQRSQLSAWRRSISPATRNIAKYILDTHDHPVIDPVWTLYARAIERCGPTATLLEWDDNIPSFDEVHARSAQSQSLSEARDRSERPTWRIE